jgi:hypothetical protein
MTPGKVPNFNSSVIRAGTELQICPTETVQEVYNKIFTNITYLEEKKQKRNKNMKRNSTLSLALILYEQIYWPSHYSCCSANT